MPQSDQIRALAMNLPHGGRLLEHDHAWDQLAYAVSGIMSVESGNSRWVVPPHRAVWLPAGAPHRIEADRPLALRLLYVMPGRVKSLPRHCSVVEVTPLVRELVLELVRRHAPDGDPIRTRLERLLIDLMGGLDQPPLTLPMPRDTRARKLAEHLTAHPDDRRPLTTLARTVGSGARTLQRLFVAETGLSFQQWRRQARLHRSLVLLAGGSAVTSVALQVGYDSPSAFVAMFRSALGETPGRYFSGN